MAEQNQSYITIDECIKDYLDESEQDNSKYFKCWQLAFRGMDMLGLDFFYNIASLKLPVNANFTVNLPPNYINYTKVGVLNAYGEVIPLTYNSKLTTYADNLSDRLSKTQDDTLLFNWYYWGTPVFYNFWNGDYFTNLYGVPSGSPFVGGFKIDNQASLILLDEAFGYSYIILEYIASPAPTMTYQIPMMFREALIAFLWWKDSRARNVKRGAVGIDRNLRSDFYNERRLANARFRPLYLTDAYEWNMENQRITVKV